MAQTSNLSVMYADLNRYGQNQDFERSLRLSNKILNEFKEETSAFHCKVVSLIQLGRFNDALTAVHKEKKLSGTLVFEKAYCEYRLNRTQEALNTLRSNSNLDYRCRELLAQVVYEPCFMMYQVKRELTALLSIIGHLAKAQTVDLYRLEEYTECYDLFRDLLKNSEDDFDEERETNLAAVLGSLSMWDEEKVDDPGLRETTYELCYNKACYLIGLNKLKAAEEKLRKAEVLCRKSLADDPDVTDDEIDEEIAIIRIQLAYVLQQQGKIDEASLTYNQVLKKRPADQGIVAVASNNIVTLNKDQNVFDSKKKMKTATADNLKQKLSSVQRRNIKINQCLLNLNTNQGDQCRSLVKDMKTHFPDLVQPVLIEAAQHSKDKDFTKAVEVLESYAKRHPENNIGINMVIAQLYLHQGSIYQACDILKTLDGVACMPGVVSALVTLYLSQEDKEAASEVLEKSVEWCKKNKPQSQDLNILRKANANFQLKNGKPRLGAKMLEEMRITNPKDARILAQLISAYSHFDPAKAQEISRDLPSVEELASSIDVDALESSVSTLGPKYLKKTQKVEPSPGPGGDVLIQKKKKRKKRKGKLPKNYDPDVIPDAERWVPRRERTYYRGKRKDKRKDISKGPQGAMTPSSDLDASKTVTATGSDTSSPKTPKTATSPQASSSASQAQGPRQQRPAQANKKKKKEKGRKR